VKYCLIEELFDDFVLPQECIYVALTHHAVYCLKKRNIGFITLEDFYSSGEIRGKTDDYLIEQLDWIDQFDELIKEFYSDARKLNINLASIYFYWLKYMVDNIIITIRILVRFIEISKPEKIWFLSSNFGEDNISHILHFQNVESTYSRLIEPVCCKHNISFERLVLKKLHPVHLKNIAKIDFIGYSLRKLKTSLSRFKKILKNLKFIVWFKPVFKKTNSNVFVLTTANQTYEFCRDLSIKSTNYFLQDNDTIISFSFPRIKKEIINSYYHGKQNADICITISNFGYIYDWVNDKCGLDVSGIIESRINYFISIICPQIIENVYYYIDFYKNNKIDFIVTHQIWTIEEHSAIAAAKYSKRTKSIYIHHGADALEAKSRFYKLVRYFDYYFTATEDEAEHENKLKNYYKHKLPQISAAHYFSSNAIGKDRKTVKKHNYKHSKKTILYVPIMCAPWPQRPIEKSQPFPMEYVEWHMALADYFSRQKYIHFIWKGYFLPKQKNDFMENVIKDKEYSNVEYQSNKLDYWLRKVDKAIFDTPSTAFFEAIFMGLPVLSLYKSKDQKLRGNAYHSFGTSLRDYSSVEEGLKIVDGFLAGDPEKYIVNLEKPKNLDTDIIFQ